MYVYWLECSVFAGPRVELHGVPDHTFVNVPGAGTHLVRSGEVVASQTESACVRVFTPEPFARQGALVRVWFLGGGTTVVRRQQLSV